MIRSEDATKAHPPIPLREVSYAPVAPGPTDKPGAEPRMSIRQSVREEAEAGVPRCRVAIVTLHGMGQQVPFETLEQVAVGLGKADGQTTPHPTATNCRFGDAQVRRLELRLNAKPGGSKAREVEAHLYEAYWAPITEGQVKLRDVFAFLTRDTWRTVCEVRTPFFRWIFERIVEFPKPLRSILSLVAALIILVNLAILNVAIPLVAASRFRETNLPIPSDLLQSFTVVMDLLLIGAAGVMIVLWAASVLKRRRLTWRRSWKWSRWPLVALSLVLLVVDLAGLLVLPIVAFALWRNPSWAAGLSRLLSSERERQVAMALTWPLLLGVTLIIRRFLVQFVGDVAAYISPQSLDRFNEIRQKIKDEVRTLILMIMGAQAPDRSWEYGSIALVGHSLGSVIAYDAVNRAMTDDALGITTLQVRDRLKVLLTFGSPLDKTAFVFGLHGKRAGLIREQLAARVQPLIEQYANRQNLTWLNVYSPFDVISGPLDYYDDKTKPEYAQLGVKDRHDPEATIPLVAHTEYWENEHIWKLLHAEVVRACESR